jgi:hypothetical protein
MDELGQQVKSLTPTGINIRYVPENVIDRLQDIQVGPVHDKLKKFLV